ncbi:DUF5694 domain-containing protein [Spirosoma flavum]|uniref:DUF5694 domain-containing protein n=1 Tax=Spirosoma flavum TaxID=2048557 RepID=A0ABW6AKV9_9BACT
MKKRFFTFLLSLLAWTAFSQQAQPDIPNIKVVLVGTFHFGDTGDRGRTAFDDLFSPKRQAEFQSFTNQLARLKPDKIFVENVPARQPHWDSTLTLYQQKRLDTNSVRNEIFQIAVRVASKAGLSQVICVDHHQSLPYDKLQDFEKRTEKDSVAQKKMAAYKLLSLQYPYPKQTQKLATSTLASYYLYINSPQADASNRADYFVYSPAYGYDDDYTGVEMITSWYDRNAKIFTNILRKADPKDKVYIVLFGSSHMLPLRHYFQNSPLFDVVDLSSVIKP